MTLRELVEKELARARVEDKRATELRIWLYLRLYQK